VEVRVSFLTLLKPVTFFELEAVRLDQWYVNRLTSANVGILE
jgi:hypothetical protein